MYDDGICVQPACRRQRKFHGPLVEQCWLTARLMTTIVCATCLSAPKRLSNHAGPVNKVWELSTLRDKLQTFWIEHNCGPLNVHEYWRYVPQLYNPQLRQNTLSGSMKFMSPVNRVWKLSTLCNKLEFSGLDRIVVHQVYMSIGNTCPNYVIQKYFRICWLGRWISCLP